MDPVETELTKLASSIKRNLDSAEQIYHAYCNANTYSTEFVQEKLRKIAEEIENLEYQIQEIKNEPQDKFKHKFWFQIAGCSCPKDLNHSSNKLIISEKCLIHGKDLK